MIFTGGDPTGGADTAAPLQAAIDQLAAQGGGTILIPRGRYTMRSYRPTTHPHKFTNLLLPSNITLEGEQGTELVQVSDGRGAVPGYVAENSVIGISNPGTYQSIAFQWGPFYPANPVALNDTDVTAINPADASYFQVGDYIGIYAETVGDVIPSEFTQVTSVDPVTGKIGLAVHLARTFATPSITNITPYVVENVHLKNLTLDGAVPLEIQEAFDITLENVHLLSDTGAANNVRTGCVINTVRNFKMLGGTIGPAEGCGLVGLELPQRNSAEVLFEDVTFHLSHGGTGEFGIHWQLRGNRFWLKSPGVTMGLTLQAWNLLFEGNAVFATGANQPGGACVSDYIGGFDPMYTALFGKTRMIGNHFVCQAGNFNPAVKSYLPGTVWTGNHIEALAGTYGAHLVGAGFVFEGNQVRSTGGSWTVLAESIFSGADSGVISGNTFESSRGGNGIAFPAVLKTGGYAINGNVFSGFQTGVDLAALQQYHPGTVVQGNVGALDYP